MFAVCKECKKYKNILRDGTCRTCLDEKRRREGLDICIKCGEIEVYLEGLCEECFDKSHGIKTVKTKTHCILCGEERIIKVYEVCSSCYDRLYSPVDVCVNCNTLTKIHGKGMCKSCYGTNR